VVQLNSPLRRKIDSAVIKLRENGTYRLPIRNNPGHSEAHQREPLWGLTGSIPHLRCNPLRADNEAGAVAGTQPMLPIPVEGAPEMWSDQFGRTPWPRQVAGLGERYENQRATPLGDRCVATRSGFRCSPMGCRTTCRKVPLLSERVGMNWHILELDREFHRYRADFDHFADLRADGERNLVATFVGVPIDE